MEIVGLNRDFETPRQALRSGHPEWISQTRATNRGCDRSIKAVVVPFRPSAIDLRAVEPVIKQVLEKNRQLPKAYGGILPLHCAFCVTQQTGERSQAREIAEASSKFGERTVKNLMNSRAYYAHATQLGMTVHELELDETAARETESKP